MRGPSQVDAPAISTLGTGREQLLAVGRMRDLFAPAYREIWGYSQITLLGTNTVPGALKRIVLTCFVLGASNSSTPYFGRALEKSYTPLDKLPHRYPPPLYRPPNPHV